jgi:hypothetical protein
MAGRVFRTRQEPISLHRYSPTVQYLPNVNCLEDRSRIFATKLRVPGRRVLEKVNPNASLAATLAGMLHWLAVIVR